MTYKITRGETTVEADTLDECVKLWRSVADSDGWIEWNGGPSPLPLGTKVEVKYRSGCIICDYQSYLTWHHFGGSSDIVAYRVVK